MAFLSLAGFTADIIGKVLLAISVYFVHRRVLREGKITKNVLRLMLRERNLALVGLILMVLGYFLQLPGKV